jgi:2-C-methyl-D-erythritol 4-phosphate cytidylyltransferase
MTGGKKVCVLVPAAGGGARMGGAQSKLLVPLGGVPVLVRTLLALERAASVDDVVLAVRPVDRERIGELIAGAGILKVRAVVPGGEERQDSVRLALASAVAGGAGIVMVHDGARPFVDGELIAKVAEAALASGAALAAVRPKDTVKIAGAAAGTITTPERASCWLAQTPQAFRTEVFVEAAERAFVDRFRGTDDVALVERLGVKVVIIEGSYRNIKITTPEDVEIAEILLKTAN